MNPPGMYKYMPPPSSQPQGNFSSANPQSSLPSQMRPPIFQNGTMGSNASSRTSSPLPPGSHQQFQQPNQVNQYPINGNQIVEGVKNMSLGAQPTQQFQQSLQNGQQKFNQNNQQFQHQQQQQQPQIQNFSNATNNLPPQNFQSNLGIHAMNKNTPSIPGLPHMPQPISSYQQPTQQPNMHHSQQPINQQSFVNNNAFQPNKISPIQYPQSQLQNPPQLQHPPQQIQNPIYSNAAPTGIKQMQPPPPTFNGKTNLTPMQYQSQVMPKINQPQLQQQQMPQIGVTQQGFNRLWGQDTVDLMQSRHILCPTSLEKPKIVLNHAFHESVNCNPE